MNNYEVVVTHDDGTLHVFTGMYLEMLWPLLKHLARFETVPIGKIVIVKK